MAVYLFKPKDVHAATTDYVGLNSIFLEATHSPIILKPRPVPTLRSIGDGQCVTYVKYILSKVGITEYSGNAIKWAAFINTDIPIVGDVIVMNIGKYGHVGIVKEIKETTIIVRSQNIIPGLVSDDEFDISDKRILGYINY